MVSQRSRAFVLLRVNKVPKSIDDTGPFCNMFCLFCCVFICDKLLLAFSGEVIFVQYAVLITVIFFYLLV